MSTVAPSTFGIVRDGLRTLELVVGRRASWVNGKLICRCVANENPLTHDITVASDLTRKAFDGAGYLVDLTAQIGTFVSVKRIY